ncbi:sensor histidine kinase [Virgisporangium aurantiacum]|uniref:Signal transduction histidine kinase subgroup 3 dimerisation and phosphoacceptor domain-containing protein n=1 Tax=Virgisporangium aurantiacum TaxID=175570 RepID=A0A8J4DZR9_9ACTN|nr:histidine kinase [Virgisporangium aurantiacum]GIJ54312.1 hypothetical protein Vau01_018280 [Virgisporangium aurantiacum]
MRPSSGDTVGVPAWTARRSAWFLAALHVPFVVAGPVVTIPRHQLEPADAVLLALTAAAIGGLQMRHSLAAAHGRRAAGAPWTFLGVCLLVYVPLPLFTWDWAIMQWFVVASAAMTLPRRLAVVVCAGPIVGQTVAAGWYVGHDPTVGPGLLVVFVLYTLTLITAGSAALVGSGWLARTLTELDEARHAQARLAATRERVRLSRDLHDLLGHSLATTSLQGDLALTLLPADPAAARAEMERVATVARRALHDIRAVTRDEHSVTLRSEIASATTLLGAAGVHTEIDLGESDLAGPVDEALAWAVREAATNTLRHSRATRWSVTTRNTSDRIRLTIVNDNALQDAARGDSLLGGLAGVAARAHLLSGRATAQFTPDGLFRLEVEIPREPW